MAKFNIAFLNTKTKEGIYDNDPDDPGKETVFGLSRVFEPEWSGWFVVEQKKKEPGFPGNLDCEEIISLAMAHYKARYWDKLGLDNCASQLIANELFDSAVNIGTGTTGKFLQLSLNALNKGQALFMDLKVDGVCGEETRVAMQKVVELATGQEVLWKCLNGWQVVYYHVGKDLFAGIVALVAATPAPEKREKYMWGWIFNRTFEK